MSGLQTQVRAATAQVAVAGGGAAGGGGAVRQVTAQLARGRGGQIVRQGGGTSLIVSQQPRHRQPGLISGPSQVGTVVARSVARPAGQPAAAGAGQIMVAASGSPVRAAGGQIMVQAAPGTAAIQRSALPGQLVMASTGQLRQAAAGGVVVVTTAGASPAAGAAGGVIVQSTAGAGAGAGGGATRQHYVISSSGAGGAGAQIVALQPGSAVRPGQLVQVAGQQGQHQIVVSSSGQIVLQPPTSKQM